MDTPVSQRREALRKWVGQLPDIRLLLPWIVLLGVFVIFGTLTPRFATWYNMKLVLMQTAIYAVAALGESFVILTGSIDLSVGSVIGLAAAVVAVAATQFPAVVALALGVVVGASIGLINGLTFVYGRIPSFVATLAMMQVARGLLLIFVNGQPVGVVDPVLLALGSNDFLGVPLLGWTVLVVWVIAYYFLEHTPFGRYTRAIGAAERVARITGVNVNRVKLLAFCLSGLAAGLAGGLYCARLGASTPTGGQGYELDVIAAVVLGGTSLSGAIGRVEGAIVGALIMGMLSNGLNIMGVSPYTQMLIKGVVLVAAALVMIDRKALTEIK